MHHFLPTSGIWCDFSGAYTVESIQFVFSISGYLSPFLSPNLEWFWKRYYRDEEKNLINDKKKCLQLPPKIESYFKIKLYNGQKWNELERRQIQCLIERKYILDCNRAKRQTSKLRRESDRDRDRVRVCGRRRKRENNWLKGRRKVNKRK